MIRQEDTICAIITPRGIGGISVIRLSGREAISIASRVFRSKSGKSLTNAKTNSIHYGHIADALSGEVFDEVLISIMRSPHSYTCEDVVEINCHGGTYIADRILEVLAGVGGRLAGPGEFTKRAFLNGRIDLVQAEAVIDLIKAKTEDGLRCAVWQLEGKLSSNINELSNLLSASLSSLEALIDFPEDDIAVALPDIEDNIRSSVRSIDELIEGYYRSQPFREGIITAIVGRTNVGKSSLLNILLGEERSIVTPHPGTTRDVVDGVVIVRGLLLRILDTAGLRSTVDIIEEEGIRRMYRSVDAAELVLLMLDGSEGLTEWDVELLKVTEAKKRIIIINKIDKGNLIEKEMSDCGSPVVSTSVVSGAGIKSLRNVIHDTVEGNGQRMSGGAVVTRLRHKTALEKTRNELYKFLDAAQNKLPLEIQALYLRGGLDSLGEITGVVTTDDILDRVFSEFCIGK